MGLFNNYTKEGPGVDVNAPRKRGIFLYFEIVGRKFWNFLKANTLYFLCSIPVLIAIMFLIAPLLTQILLPQNLYDDSAIVILTNALVTFILYNYFGAGPISAAYSYVTREFTRSKPVWVLSDGFDAFKANWKQSLMLLVVDFLFMFFVMIAIKYYGSGTGILSFVLCYMMIFIFVIYALAHSFAYQIIVTYKCSFINVIKNSIIMTLAKLPMCLLLGFITLVLNIVIIYYVGSMDILLFCVVYGVLATIITKYPLEFYAARVIEKNIEKTESNKSQGEDEE